MTENLNKKPPKGILKTSSSFDTACVSNSSCGAAGARRNSGVLNNDQCGGASCGSGGSSSSGPVPPVTLPNELTVADLEEEGAAAAAEGYVHVRKHSKTAKFDEMNILETYHPASKTYGHMKIEEPKTPFSYYEDADEELESCATTSHRGGGGPSCPASSADPSSSSGASSSRRKLDPSELARKLEESVGRGDPDHVLEQDEDDEDEEDGEEDPESRAARVKFESKRKAHYNEYYAVKLARKLMEQDEDEEDEEEDHHRNPRVQHDNEDSSENEIHANDKFIPEEEIDVMGAAAGPSGDDGTVERMVDG